MPTKILYQTSAVAHGGRDGKSGTTDGAFEVTLAVPKELGGNGQGNNPEQLFASGYAACFLGAIKYVAGKEKKSVSQDASVKATVGIGPREDDGFGLDVALEISLPGMDRAEAQELMEKAHVVCPYSHATRNNLDVRLSLAN